MNFCVGGQIPSLQLSLRNLMSRLEASWQIFSVPALFHYFQDILRGGEKIVEFLFYFIGILINLKEAENGMLGQQ